MVGAYHEYDAMLDLTPFMDTFYVVYFVFRLASGALAD